MENILIRTALGEDDGSFLLNKGKFDEARIYYEGKLCKLTAQLGRDQLEFLNVKEKLAWSVYEKGNFLEAKELFEEVVREREIILGDSHPQCTRVYMLMSVLIRNLGNKSEGDLLYKKLSKILDKMDKRDENYALSCLQISISYLNLCKTTDAERILEELQQLQGSIFWKNLPLSLLIKVVSVRTLLEAGEYAKAVTYLQDIYKSCSDLSTKDHSLYYLCRRRIALCSYGMGKFSEVKIQLEEILKEQTKTFGNNNAERLSILVTIAECCNQLEKFGEAKSLLEEVLRKVIDIYGKESFFYFENSLRICKTIIYLGNFPEAKSLLEEMSRKIAHAFGEGNQLFLQVLTLRAELKIEMGKNEEAAVILEELLLKQLDVVGKYHLDYLGSKRILAEVLYTSCKFTESKYIFEDLLRLLSSMFRADHLEGLAAKMWIAKISIRIRKFAESETLLKEVVRSLKEKLGEEHNVTVNAMGLLAATLFCLGKKEEGFPLLEIYVRKMEVTKNNLDLISIISLRLMEVGEWEILKKVVEKSLLGTVEILGDYHINTLECQVKLAYCLLRLRKLAEAREVIYNALAKIPKVCTQNVELYLEVKEGIANGLTGLGEHEKAIILLKEIMKTWQEKGNDSKVLSTMVLIAQSLYKIGKFSEMKPIVKKGLIRLSEVDLEEDHNKYVNVAAEFIAVGVMCEYHTRTINLCQKLLSLPHNIFGENHPQYLLVMEVLGASFMALGDIAETKRIYLELLKKIKEIHGENNEVFRRVKRHFLALLYKP